MFRIKARVKKPAKRVIHGNSAFLDLFLSLAFTFPARSALILFFLDLREIGDAFPATTLASSASSSAEISCAAARKRLGQSSRGCSLIARTIFCSAAMASPRAWSWSSLSMTPSITVPKPPCGRSCGMRRNPFSYLRSASPPVDIALDVQSLWEFVCG
jgi:hypothetical protein